MPRSTYSNPPIHFPCVFSPLWILWHVDASVFVDQVTIDHTADWWLGDLDDPWFKALETAVCEEWGVEPLRIREGGVRFFLVVPHALFIYIYIASLSPPCPAWKRRFSAVRSTFRSVRARCVFSFTLIGVNPRGCYARADRHALNHINRTGHIYPMSGSHWPTSGGANPSSSGS